jgi:hypothetical protein
MATAAVALRKDERPDERAELRRAIAAAKKARAAVDKQHDAIERAKELVAEAVGTLAAASAAVNTARQDHAQHIASVITGGGSPTSTGLIRAACAHERDAQDDLAASKAALSSLQADLADLESDAAVASRAVGRALATTLEPLCRRLVAETRAQYARFLETQAALSAVSALFDPWSPVATEAGLAGLFSDALASQSSAVREQWKAALSALRSDPGHCLPELMGMGSPDNRRKADDSYRALPRR